MPPASSRGTHSRLPRPAASKTNKRDAATPRGKQECLPPNTLVLDLHATTGKRFIPFLRLHLPAAHAILDPPLAELSLALVGDARMAQLHEQFLGIPGPTDVLTFPLDTDHYGRPTSGEVVVCVPEAGRRAKELGNPVERELLLYALHGLLHLCGHDDKTDSGYRRMHRTEDMILTQLGVGPVFNTKRRAIVSPESKPAKARTRRASRRTSPANSGEARR